MKPLVHVGVAALLSGCAADYAYVPLTNATQVRTRFAAQYSVPPEAPRGTLQLVSYGATTVQPAGSDLKQRTLHVRAIIRNDDDAVWTFDPREQRIDLEAPLGSPATFASPAGPVLVPPQSRRVVDLYFALPPNERRLPGFDIVWSLHTERGTTTRRTEFERVSVEPPPGVYYQNNGPLYWGSGYYYSPGYGW